MEGSFNVACGDQDGTEVAVLFMVPGGGSEVGWAGPASSTPGRPGATVE
jgi:hypothetical protein